MPYIDRLVSIVRLGKQVRILHGTATVMGEFLFEGFKPATGNGKVSKSDDP